MGNKCCACFGSTMAMFIDPPTIKKVIDYKRLTELLKVEYPDVDIMISDRNYGLYSVEDARRFIKYNAVKYKKYRRDQYDCDDFAKSSYGMEKDWYSGAKRDIIDSSKTPEDEKYFGSPFGIAFIKIKESADDSGIYHCVNILIDDKENIITYEPQSGVELILNEFSYLDKIMM